MKATVFDYKDYKKYLKDWLDNGPSGGRGARSALAEYIGCQTAYVSQVLNAGAHFSLEQADQINRFVEHTAPESDFFLLLVQHARAGTPSLRKYFDSQIAQIIERRLVLKDRLDVKKTLSREDQVIYYSHWYYSTVHVALSIPELQTKEALAKYLGFPVKKVSEILDYLVSVGLATHEQGRFKIGATKIHIGTDSPMLTRHHANWRMHALRTLDRDADKDTHYSSVVTMSKADVVKLKEMIIGFLNEARTLVRASKEEEVHAFCIDFFQV